MNNFKGYGFRPSEEELIGHLRDRTLLGRDYLVQDITDLGVDICKWGPWDLPGRSMVTSSDLVWYFIYPITYKHPDNNPKIIDMATNKGPDSKQKRKWKRKPINRATNDGQWKVSGDPVLVRASESKEIGIKTRLYFYTSRANNENNKRRKAKNQSSYQNKTPWVLYEYQLIDVDPSQNKYFLGKLMMNQSKQTNISSSKGETSQQLPSNYLENDQFPTPEVQLDFHQESLVEMEVSNDYDWIQNQSSEQTNEFVNSFHVVNYETYPEERSNQENFINDGNEVMSNLKPSNLENYVADYAIPQNLQVDYSELMITNLEVPAIGIGAQNQLYTNQHAHSFQNVLIDNDETYPEERSNQHNIVAENKGFNLPYNLQVDYSELITNPEVPDIGIRAQNQLFTNQHDLSFQNVLVDNDETYPEERSNQHNIVAENEGFNLPYNFNNYPIADISQMNLFGFDYWDGLYLHELFGVPEAPDNNGDGVQNQSSINQQIADEFRNSNLIDNEIAYTDERSKSDAAEIEGSNLPFLGMTESSYPMESFRIRSGMEHEGSSIDIETEVTQAQAKKSRFRKQMDTS